MRTLSASDILGVWERGLGQPPVRRAIELLAAADPETPVSALLDLSIGRRDEQLLALRERLFGPGMAGVAACPSCAGRLEMTVDAADLRTASARDGAAELALDSGQFQVRFRPPNSQDLLAAGAFQPEDRREVVLRRCVLAVERAGAPAEPEDLPAEVAERIAGEMANADPLADVQLALSCPFCGHQWLAAFDIASFLWKEIEAAAGRLLREVHCLAAAYGWSETEVLALSPMRRQHYLAMVGE